jgi:Spy/CpxP family protein refolding chaperone
MGNVRKIAVLALGLSLAVCATASAAEDEAAGVNEPPKAMAERMRALRSRMLREKVGLDEATAARAEKVIDEFQVKQRALWLNLFKNGKALRELVNSDSKDQNAYTVGVNNLLDAHKRLQELRQEEFAVLQKILSPKQQAKLLLSLREIQGKAGHMMKGACHKKMMDEGMKSPEDGEGPPPPCEFGPPPPGEFGPPPHGEFGPPPHGHHGE